MKILHLEASPGWGGQEIRILKEAIGMRERGHTVVFALQKGGGLVGPARESGFAVYELKLLKRRLLCSFFHLFKVVRKEKIDLLNTHSSLDAWLGGVVAKILRKKVIRTRHLSTPIRKGLNSFLLYNVLADFVVTTCGAVATTIRRQARLDATRCRSIPTGIDPKRAEVQKEAIEAFRKKLGVGPNDILAGTCCVLRGWKGVSDLLHAAKVLQKHPHLKWIVIGSGVSEAHFLQEQKTLRLQDTVFFVGHQDPPDTALAALDIFLLLSWAHEGVSQASLQAALLQKPLITTTVGGLPEVCIPNKTGLLVTPKQPSEIASAVAKLMDNPEERKQMGICAHQLVQEKFTFEKMLNDMEEVYRTLCHKKN